MSHFRADRLRAPHPSASQGPLATARTGPEVSTPHLEDFCATLHRDGLLDRLPVGGLEPDDVAELLEAGGWASGGPGAQAIHRATGGNPFFVTELAHHGASPDDVLPDSIRTVLDARLDRLDDQTARLVALAAVAGPDAAIPVLARAGGFSGDEVLDHVDAAIGVGVLTEDGPTGSVTVIGRAPRRTGGGRSGDGRRVARGVLTRT